MKSSKQIENPTLPNNESGNIAEKTKGVMTI